MVKYALASGSCDLSVILSYDISLLNVV